MRHQDTAKHFNNTGKTETTNQRRNETRSHSSTVVIPFEMLREQAESREQRDNSTIEEIPERMPTHTGETSNLDGAPSPIADQDEGKEQNGLAVSSSQQSQQQAPEFSDLTDEDVEEIMSNLSKFSQGYEGQHSAVKGKKCLRFTGKIGSKRLRRAAPDKVVKVLNSQLSKNQANCFCAAVSPIVWPLFIAMMHKTESTDWFDTSALADSAASEQLVVCAFSNDAHCRVTAQKMTPSTIAEVCAEHGIESDLFVGHASKTFADDIVSQNRLLLITRWLFLLAFASMLATTVITIINGSLVSVIPVGIAIFLYRRNPFEYIVSDDEGTSIDRVFKTMKLMRESGCVPGIASEIARIVYKTSGIQAERASGIAYIALVALILCWNIIMMIAGASVWGTMDTTSSVWG